MKNNKMILFCCVIVAFQSVYALPCARGAVRAMTNKAAGKEKLTLLEKTKQLQDFMAGHIKNFQEQYRSFSPSNSVQKQVVQKEITSLPGIAQAAKTQAEQNAHASGFLNFPKNTTTTTTYVTHNYNYAQNTWSTGFFTWLKEGGQKRSAGVGLIVGGIGGYGLHAATVEKQEKIIVVQAPSN